MNEISNENFRSNDPCSDSKKLIRRMGRWADRNINCYGNEGTKYHTKVSKQLAKLEDTLTSKLKCDAY